jgi:hypothetical protein
MEYRTFVRGYSSTVRSAALTYPRETIYRSTFVLLPGNWKVFIDIVGTRSGCPRSLHTRRFHEILLHAGPDISYTRQRARIYLRAERTFCKPRSCYPTNCMPDDSVPLHKRDACPSSIVNAIFRVFSTIFIDISDRSN